MRKKKLISLLAVAAMVVTSFAVTGCEKPGGKGTEVGIVLPTKDEQRWIQDEKNFKSALDDAGFTSEVMFSQKDSAVEATNVETLINKKIKVLILAAVDCEAAAASAEKAQEAGIKVIAYDRLITNTEAVDYYATFDNIKVGEAQGQYLVDNAPKDKKDVPLYLYGGDDTDNNAYSFFQGAWNVLQPKIADGTFKIANSSEAEKLKDKKDLKRDEQDKIIKQVTTKWNDEKAKSLAESHVGKASADMKGDVCILAPNDDVSRAISDVFHKDSAYKSVVITGQDATTASVKSIIEGTQSMTVFKDTRNLVKETITMTESILKDKTPETNASDNNKKKDVPSIHSEIKVVTKENYKEALIDSKYYSEDDIK